LPSTFTGLDDDLDDGLDDGLDEVAPAPPTPTNPTVVTTVARTIHALRITVLPV